MRRMVRAIAVVCFPAAVASTGCHTDLRVVSVRSGDRGAFVHRDPATAIETVLLCDAGSDPPCHRVPILEVSDPVAAEAWLDFEDVDPELGLLLRVTDEEAGHVRSVTLEPRASDLVLDDEAEWGRIVVEERGLERTILVGGAAGGYEDARALGGVCIGSISERPSVVLELGEGAPSVALTAVDACHEEADCGDLVLVARAGDGRVFCADDPEGGGRDPSLVLDAAGGTYRVWVGTYDAAPPFRAVLAVSDRRVVPPEALRVVAPDASAGGRTP